jgi:transglutaminase-like putative cysteine protease
VRKLRIEHVTEYRFAAWVTLLPHRLLLRPRESHGVHIVASQLSITPGHAIRWQHDALDNSVALVSFHEIARSLRIASQVTIEHYGDAPLDFIVDAYATFYPFAYEPEDVARLAPMLGMAWPAERDAVAGYLQQLGLPGSGLQTFGLLDQLNRAISRDFRYQAREEPGVQSPATTLQRRSGSCRDLAALLLDACRHLGIACRFVSGYHTSYASEVGPGSTHAWVEAYLPGPGWTGFDPTAGMLAGSEHIAVAVARHPETVPPVAGSFLGPSDAQPVMSVSVHVITL